MPDLTWSDSEKKIARRAFDAAFDSAAAGVIAAFKAKAAAVETTMDMKAVEDWARQQRQNLDTLFDYRYSQLILVFAQLINLGHLDEALLAGLREEKLAIIRDTLKRIRDF